MIRRYAIVFASQMRVVLIATLVQIFCLSIGQAQILGPAEAPKDRAMIQARAAERMVDELATAKDIILHLHEIPTHDLHERVMQSFDTLRRGMPVNIAFTIGDESPRPMRLRFTVRTKMEYEMRPVGGILRIETDLLPMFAGILTSNRPIARHEFSQAVDYIEPDELTDFVYDHIQKLGEEYAQKSVRQHLYWEDQNPEAANSERSR